MAARIPTEHIPEEEELIALLSAEFEDMPEYGAPLRPILRAWEERIRMKLLEAEGAPTAAPHRWRLPDEFQSVTHHFSIPQADEPPLSCYVLTGLYPSGKVGEIKLPIAKQGSLVSGLLKALAETVSIGLQHGIPLSVFTDNFKFSRFQPAGFVQGAIDDSLRGYAHSILDYLGRYLEHKFPNGYLEHPRITDE